MVILLNPERLADSIGEYTDCIDINPLECVSLCELKNKGLLFGLSVSIAGLKWLLKAVLKGVDFSTSGAAEKEFGKSILEGKALDVSTDECVNG